MTHIITQSCCNDAACVPVCPVNCIHPAPDEAGYGTTEMLYIDPTECIDCGACLDVCPVSAISRDYELPERSLRYGELNALYYSEPENQTYDRTPALSARRRWDPFDSGPLRVAVIGSGPAACYAAEELLAQRGLDVAVDMFERLPVPWGLVRYGVAPDHQDTKAATESFEKLIRNDAFRLILNVEVGIDVRHEELARHYSAVIYAVGAPDARQMGIPGEELPGSHSAAEFVAWYNGHPDYADRTFDLSGERVVVVGNGNVALDVARVLLSDVDHLARTDIADHALEALRSSKVREVVIVGRRSALEAAFTVSELMGLASVDGVNLRIDGPTGFDGTTRTEVGWLATMRRYKVDLLHEMEGDHTKGREVVFRFLSSPREILGDRAVKAVVLAHNDLVEIDGAVRAVTTGRTEEVSCSLVLSSIGYRARGIDGLPFDEVRGVVPNDDGRVVDPESSDTVIGVYVTGWVKRGPSGMIGTNKHCARGTVAALLDDIEAGVLRHAAELDDIVDQLPHSLDAEAWRRIDERERSAGRPRSRPRVKLVDVAEMTAVGRGTG